MATRLSSVKPLIRSKLGSKPSNGHAVFLPQIRKLVFEYSAKSPSSANTRTYLLNHVEALAKQNPHVEVVVRQRSQQEPIIRGFYLNDRDKVISLKEFEVNGIQKKVKLLLDSSGAKIRMLKKPVESTTEAARGIWSGLHADRPTWE